MNSDEKDKRIDRLMQLVLYLIPICFCCIYIIVRTEMYFNKDKIPEAFKILLDIINIPFALSGLSVVGIGFYISFILDKPKAFAFPAELIKQGRLKSYPKPKTLLIGGIILAVALELLLKNY